MCKLIANMKVYNNGYTLLDYKNISICHSENISGGQGVSVDTFSHSNAYISENKSKQLSFKGLEDIKNKFSDLFGFNKPTPKEDVFLTKQEVLKELEKTGFKQSRKFTKESKNINKRLEQVLKLLEKDRSEDDVTQKSSQGGKNVVKHQQNSQKATYYSKNRLNKYLELNKALNGSVDSDDLLYFVTKQKFEKASTADEIHKNILKLIKSGVTTNIISTILYSSINKKEEFDDYYVKTLLNNPKDQDLMYFLFEKLIEQFGKVNKEDYKKLSNLKHKYDLSKSNLSSIIKSCTSKVKNTKHLNHKHIDKLFEMVDEYKINFNDACEIIKELNITGDDYMLVMDKLPDENILHSLTQDLPKDLIKLDCKKNLSDFIFYRLKTSKRTTFNKIELRYYSHAKFNELYKIAKPEPTKENFKAIKSVVQYIISRNRTLENLTFKLAEKQPIIPLKNALPHLVGMENCHDELLELSEALSAEDIKNGEIDRIACAIDNGRGGCKTGYDVIKSFTELYKRHRDKKTMPELLYLYINAIENDYIQGKSTLNNDKFSCIMENIDDQYLSKYLVIMDNNYESRMFPYIKKMFHAEVKLDQVRTFLDTTEPEDYDERLNTFFDLKEKGLSAKSALVLSKYSPEEIDRLFEIRELFLKHRNTLASADETLTDEDIDEAIFDNGEYDLIKAVDTIGEDTLVQSFNEKLDNVEDYLALFSQSSHYPEQNINFDDEVEKLVELINPTNSKKYKEIESAIIDAKKRLKEITSNAKQQISCHPELVSGSYQNGDTNEVGKMLPSRAILHESQFSAKAVNQVQHDSSITDNNQAVKQLIEKITDLSKQKNDILRNAIKDPKDKLEAASIFYSIIPEEPDWEEDKDYNVMLEDAKKNINTLLPMMSPKTEAERQQYYDKLNELIWSALNISEITPETEKRFDFKNSKYLPKLFNADGDFQENFDELVKLLNKYPDKTNLEIFNSLEQNIETKRQFKKLGLNYKKWVTFDPNSKLEITVNTDSEKQKQSAIKNLEADFNDELFKKIPKEEVENIKKALNQKDFRLVEQDEAIYEGDGFLSGTKKILRLYKNDRPIEFEDMKSIIKILKQAMTENKFWSEEIKESDIENARDTLKNHILKLRYNEVKNASDKNADKEINLVIQKSDMNDLTHALFLGNDASCCTAVGTGCNQCTAPNYVKNKLISSIEVKDGDLFAGNTMMFIAEIDGSPALILDNIELKPKYQFNDKIRDGIIEYAKIVTKELGKPDMPIYAGPNRHKVTLDIFPFKAQGFNIVGSTGRDDIYLDFDSENEAINSCNNTFSCELYKIR